MVHQRIGLTLHTVGSLLKYFSLTYLFPLAAAFYYNEEWHIFLYSLLLTLGIGVFLEVAFKTTKEIERGDGFSIVSLAWLALPLLGAIPYMFLGWSFLNAFFEAMSGFTTTGATILESVEGLPRGILLWRSLTQWLGGMGVITLFVAILPRLRVGGAELFEREFPGPLPEKLHPRISRTAGLLWTIYVAFTIAEMAALCLCARLPVFDSVCISLCTLPTGGFTPTTASIGAYANPLAEYIIMVFMLLAGMNFIIHYHVLRRNLKIVKDEEFRLYLILLGASALLVTLSQGLGSYRCALFSVISITTTTGFVTCDFGSWNLGVRMVLLVLMFVGGCGGSTGGAIKVVRILALLRYTRVMMRRALLPKAIIPVKYNQKPLPQETIQDIISLFFLYLLVAVVSAVTLGFLGLDLETSLSAVAATMGNVGPGLGGVGPASNYAWLSGVAKALLIALMWLGRLELFTVFMVFLPSFWRR